ncbi:MAG: septum site-determining protein MinC [Methylococcaceae bacterium]|nr:septum site-determining protein MinC [Methylococcaceae bacterium]
MSIDSTAVSNQRPAIEFKSSTFAVPALIINSADLKEVNAKILQKIQQAPEFFKNSPVLLDIHSITTEQLDLKLAELIKLIRGHTLIPIALRGGHTELNDIALKSGLFIQPLQTLVDTDKPKTSAPPLETKKSPPASTDPGHPVALRSPIRTDRRTKDDGNAISRIITSPIRSGQRVYSEGDLIIMSQVSAGAEIMAEGNIHVYGSLRGRALAGVLGKLDSRIFCFDCQAELISIAGNYKVKDDLDPAIQHKPIQIYLQNQALIIKAL